MSRAERADGRTGRVAEFETIDGEAVIYDRDNAEAWIQSDATVSFGRTRPLGPVVAEP